MAEATVTVTITHQPGIIGGMQFVMGTLAVTAAAATYDEGGLDLSFALAGIKSSRAPLHVQVKGRGESQLLFEYRFVPGTDNSDGKLRIFGSGANADDPFSELADNAAIPAGVSGDVIEFLAIFAGML